MDRAGNRRGGRSRLAIVAELAGTDNWTVDAGNTPGTRVVWVWLDWPKES
jgi:hypothetical protein